MTPKEKAQKLFDKFYIICQEYTEEIQCSLQAEQCALVAVDEILNELKFNSDLQPKIWLEVKREIEKL